MLYAPENPHEKLPLLMVFHGFSGNAERIRRSSQLHELVEKHRFYLAYLDGDPTWRRPGANKPCADVEFFDHLCEDLEKRYKIDTDRIYLAGMSMGGDFVIRLGGVRSNRVAAVVSQGMIMEDIVESERAFPLMIIVGTEDDRVPAHVFPDVPDAYRALGHEVIVIRPEGVGHRWHKPLNEDLWSFLAGHSIK